MTTQGPRSPTTTVDDSSTGTEIWTSPNNTQVSDSTYASVAHGSRNHYNSHYIKATGFGFTIPAGATIDGIYIEVEGYSVNSGTTYIPRIVKGGVIGSTNPGATFLGTSNAYVDIYPSATHTYLWGDTWASADINDSTFGFAVAVSATASTTTYIDHIRITIYYTAGGGGASSISQIMHHYKLMTE